jgi:hypothetical protein
VSENLPQSSDGHVTHASSASIVTLTRRLVVGLLVRVTTALSLVITLPH